MPSYQEWRDAVSYAPDEKTVLSLVRDCVDAVDPSVIEAMPDECRAVLHPSTDLHYAAVTLLHTELSFDGDVELARHLREVAYTFAAASIRVSRLRMEPILPVPR